MILVVAKMLEYEELEKALYLAYKSVGNKNVYVC